ncbi:MAG: dipeptide/oligopeptide/nickel ABC transporter ATP-binding protein [Endomicrobium sp.]|jgi:ABC-type oligopeptide transport system ATPase subunit|nr:dipeptide/oligopeptide/nickel ABC transporter ATP-binding protein [Endomicrobium sp.]
MFLEVKNLSKTYTDKKFFGENKFNALDGVDFSMKDGESLSVIGGSGSGKTTFGRIISKLLDFDGGSVKYYGKDIKSYNITEFSGIVQMIFQNPYASLNPKLKIRSSLLEAFGAGAPSNAEDIIEKTLESAGLEKKILDNFPHQFSGGQRQRIAVARALIKKPKLIVADEPFASLDVYSQNNITEIFKSVRKNTGVSIILITHDIAAAIKFADRMIIMNEGKIIKDDSSENVFKEKENAYITDLLAAMEI